MRGLGELVEIERGGKMGYHVDLVPGMVPKHSYPPAYRNHRLLKPPYIRLIGIYFLLACSARALPTWLVMWAAPVAFGRWIVTCGGAESADVLFTLL